MSKELKLFCDKFNIDFPTFKIIEQDFSVICSITWYNDINIIGEKFIDREKAILSALSKLSEWLKYEENFIYLLMKQKDMLMQ